MPVTKENIRQLQETMLNILIEFDSACRKMGLKYTLSGGTLLGAVRHGGFIPWDDDIDVAMLREDYEIFLHQGQKYLPDHLFIQHYETDPNYPHNFIKLIDTRTTLVEYVTSNVDMKKCVFIDIFPIDRIPRSRFLRFIDRQLLAFSYFTRKSLTLKYRQPGTPAVQRIMAALLYPLALIIGNQRLNRWETAVKTKYNNRSNCEYTYADNSILYARKLEDSMIMPIHLFYELEEIDFEGHSFMAIKNRDLYLRKVYGDHYMELPPEEDRVFKHVFTEMKLTS